MTKIRVASLISPTPVCSAPPNPCAWQQRSPSCSRLVLGSAVEPSASLIANGAKLCVLPFCAQPHWYTAAKGVVVRNGRPSVSRLEKTPVSSWPGRGAKVSPP